MSEDSSPPKTGSNSSRRSGGPMTLESRPWAAERVRASSWDDSDDDLGSQTEKSGSKTHRIFSADGKRGSGSVASEINELKKQFFESLRKESDKSNVSTGSRTGTIDSRTSYDRRQSPARIRRRTRSSSSSPVRESISQISAEERELDQISFKSADYDPKFYLNNFFSETRNKRISLVDGAPAKEDGTVYDSECIDTYNNSNAKDGEGFLCKTSRKLSQILEVEENRRELDKKSEENLDMFQKNFKTHEDYSPLETARSRKGDEILDSLQQAQKEEKVKPINFDDFANFHTIPRASRGSISERAAGIFQPKIPDEFISLSAKTGKTQLASPMQDDADGQLQFYYFTTPAPVKGFPREVFARDKGKNSESNESFSKSWSPRKSTDRSEIRTDRTRSGRSRAGNLESPKFVLSIDSARSLKVEDMDTPDSLRKDGDGKISSPGSRKSNRSEVILSPDSLKKSGMRKSNFGMEDVTKVNSDSSEVSFEQKPEKRLRSPDSSCGSVRQQESIQLTAARVRRRSRELRESGQSSPKSPDSCSGRNQRGSSNRSPKPDNASWSQLIDTFQENPNYPFSLENHFPGFPLQRDVSWDSTGKTILNENKIAEDSQEESKEVKPLGDNSANDRSLREADENMKNSHLDYNDYLLEHLKKEEVDGPLQTPQKLFYFNVAKRGPFEIGEFGDVTYCPEGDVTEKLQITGNSDTVDYGKPKDHGDGIPTKKVLALAADKREKDVKMQRQFWTELRRDFRGTPYKMDVADDGYFPRYIPMGLKTSKSDNCISTRLHDEIHAIDESSKTKTKNVENGYFEDEKENKKEKITKSKYECFEGSSEDSEFDCERTPRLSRSLSDLDAKEVSETKTNVARFLEKGNIECDDPKDSTNLSVFLASNQEKMMTNSNWLQMKNRGRTGWSKNSKSKKKKQKEQFQDYLCTRKSRQPVPPLKLRNSNCFQNFYKRFISVFCLTSNSAATSK